MCFTNCFEGINALSVLLADLHDFTETTLSNDFEELERLDCKRFVTARFEYDLKMEFALTCVGCIPLIGDVLRPVKVSRQLVRIPNDVQENQEREADPL